ncbi:MAG: GtrA family protein [Gammaproteobacteria bacterium]
MRLAFSTKPVQWRELTKYLYISILVYVYIMIAMFTLVDYWQLDPVLSFVVVYLGAYVSEYILTLHFVFKENHQWKKIFKYIIYIAIFLCLSTLLYKILLYLGIHYLMATILTAITLMPARFVVNKYWVYHEKEGLE